MADPFTSWMWKVRAAALSRAQRGFSSPYAESPTQTSYLDRQALVEERLEERISIHQVVASHPLASFCKIINVPHQIKIVQFKDLRDPRHAHLVETVTAHLFAQLSIDESELVANHLAHLDDGFVIFVPAGFTGHLQLGFLLKEVPHFHVLMIAGEGARLWMTVDVRSEHAHASYVQEMVLSAGAQVSCLLRESAPLGNLFSLKRTTLQEGSTLTTTVASKAQGTLVTKTRTTVAGRGTRNRTLALFGSLGIGRIEQESSVHHLAPGGESETVTRGVCADSSVALVRGVIRIEEQAPQTSSHYEGKVLLLSPEAKANVLPTLQIFTNDVSAKHGAAVGHCSEEELFYLQSRGLSAAQARELLVNGFFAPVLSRLSSQEQEGLRSFFGGIIGTGGSA